MGTCRKAAQRDSGTQIDMESVTVTVKGESYPIAIGVGFETDLLHAIANIPSSKIAIITDTGVKKHWGKEILTIVEKSGKPVELFTFPAGEKNKNQRTVTTLQHALLKNKYGRDTLILAFGGGVVGDLAGFVAATFLRGVPFIQIPTTVLAMVDSSIGGKVGIDTAYGKNTIGAFYQPKGVYADLRFIKTQKADHVVNGLMEAIKTFFTSDKQSLELVENIDPMDPAKDLEVMREIVIRSVRIKGGIVERDETEKAERMVVNFGHTIGHAVELLSKFKLQHGFCVGYGMLAEAKISELMGVLPGADRLYIEGLLKKFGVTSKPLHKFPIKKILEATRMDKKSKGGVPQYVLLKEIGSVQIENGMYAHPVPDTTVEKAFKLI
jgi:3-dehydroquinate synthase